MYSEVEDTLPLVQDLLNGGELPNADEVESLEKYTVEDHLPGVFLNGTIAVSRMPGTSGVRVGEDGPFLLLCDTELNELSDFAAECWLQAEGDISYDDLFARLAEIFEGLPAEAYDENLSALAAGSMLWVRVIDDPLIDDATWAQLTSDEVLDEEEQQIALDSSEDAVSDDEDDVVED